MNNKKWSNYFLNIQNKYNLKINVNKPIVIFIDGKDITKNLKYNLIQEDKGSFNDIFEQTITHFSEKFNCIAISGVDEVSFVLKNSKELGEKMYRAQEIVSLFSQYFYKYFNDKYTNSPVYWHCKCSNIPKGKIKSYIKYRSLTIHELYLTYFLKRKQVKDAGKIPLNEKEEKCNEIDEYKEIERYSRGRLYINGKQIELESFLNDKIVELPDTIRKDEIKFLDLNDFE